MNGKKAFQFKGWSRNLKTKGLLFFVTLGLWVVNTGCTQLASSQDSNPIDQSGVVVGKAFSVAGPLGTVSITGTGPGISCQAASPQTSPPSLTCTANTAGVAELTVSVTLANGGTETWTSNITVNLPGSLSNDALVVALSQGSFSSTVTTTSISTVPQGTMNSPVAFNVSGSTFAKPADVTVTWNFGDGTTITTGAGVMSTTHTYTQPGKFEIIVSSNDTANGGNSIVQFDFTSLCDASVPPVQVTDISVTQEDGNNFFQYTATVSGGSGDYTTAWIPDGTGVYRNTVVGLTSDYYVDYPGSSRNVTVALNDLACGTTANLSQSFAFNIPTAGGMVPITQGTYVPQGPQVGNIPFIQGMLASSAFPSDPRMNSMLAILEPSTDTVSRISGTYEFTGSGAPGSNPYPGTFQMSAFTGNPLMNANGTPNTSGDGDGITNFTATFDASGNMTCSAVSVSISGNQGLGSEVQDQYSTSTAFPCQGTVTVLMGANPCGPSATPAQVALGYTVDFAYGPATVTDSSANTLQITQGAGFFPDAVANYNCGGGQGGGGTPPPAF